MTLPEIKHRPALLDLFCGRGGWTKGFLDRGWWCVGVDLAEHPYPGVLVRGNVLDLDRDWIEQFDAVTSSPPCEEFARAHMPWHRGDGKPAEWAMHLLAWSIDLCSGRKRRITECSLFAARHFPGAVRTDSWALWGDVPLLLPRLPRIKGRVSGLKPALRAEIPRHLAVVVARWFEGSLGC